MNIEYALERYIIEEIQKGDDRMRIGANQSLISSGFIDSLSLLQLISYIEEEFDVTIDDSDVTPDNFETISLMKELIERKLQVS
jgi:acyl carrier protein